MANKNLGKAKTEKNDEFYTQYADIQQEMNAYIEYNPDVFRNKTILLPCDDPEWSNFTKFFAQNFEQYGIKKLISTSYAPESKKINTWQPTLFETENPHFDADKSKTNGKIFVLDRDSNGNGRINIEDLQWDYLEGDGDFRSAEVCALRDEADIIITNPQMQKWGSYIKGDPKRQEILRTALSWVAHGPEHIDGYMSQHRQDTTIQELQSYFDTVIDWAKGVFGSPYDEMKGQPWGELYEKYHNNPYNTQQVRQRIEALLADEYVSNKRGIFEYILGGELDKSLLNVRIFDERTKRAKYALQTEEAKAAGHSNCPYCAMSDNANRTRIWKLTEMDADHVTAWSNGGATDISNCEMLCKSHNRAKGNR